MAITNSAMGRSTTATRRAKVANASAACGNCCWRLSSKAAVDFHANLDNTARPLCNASAESAARDITSSTGRIPPICPSVHIVWSGSRMPQLTRTSIAPRARNLCATLAFPSTREAINCMAATSTDSPSSPAPCAARSVANTASSPPFSTNKVPRLGRPSTSSRSVEQHAQRRSRDEACGGERSASSIKSTSVSAWGHATVPTFPCSRCPLAMSYNAQAAAVCDGRWQRLTWINSATLSRPPSV
mmetsp:Transcript_60980/g.170592  ORF Transcript_60980/g.170592 Transcript_60980/m.170592 type:complete len:244 (-) Transcript_60980:430-1161(-)